MSDADGQEQESVGGLQEEEQEVVEPGLDQELEADKDDAPNPPAASAPGSKRASKTSKKDQPKEASAALVSKTGGRDRPLWEIAIDIDRHRQMKGTEGPEENADAAASEAAAQAKSEAEEWSVIFVGSRNSGKTSLILRVLERDEPPKPTTALEYTFGRRARGHNLAKDIGHLWELGGGTFMAKLISIPLNPENLLTNSIVMVLDLSNLKELWITLETLLEQCRKRIDECIKELNKVEPGLKEALYKAAKLRLKDHPDRDMLAPFPIPLVIIGSKYDVFQDFDSEQKKIVCKALRFVAHYHGGTLQFYSIKAETLMLRTKALIGNLVFRTPLSKQIVTDYNKPLAIPAGMDKLESIGAPPIKEGDMSAAGAKTPMDLWKAAFCSHFPQEKRADPAAQEDPAQDKQYLEPAVDSTRAQKDEELERYRRAVDRREKHGNEA